MASDTLPYGNRSGVPFTRDEMFQAHRDAGWPERYAEDLVRAIYEPDPETQGISISDGSWLLLAALSREVAERAVASRPDLRVRVAEVRADPEAFLERERTCWEDEH